MTLRDLLLTLLAIMQLVTGFALGFWFESIRRERLIREAVADATRAKYTIGKCTIEIGSGGAGGSCPDSTSAQAKKP